MGQRAASTTTGTRPCGVGQHRGGVVATAGADDPGLDPAGADDLRVGDPHLLGEVRGPDVAHHPGQSAVGARDRQQGGSGVVSDRPGRQSRRGCTCGPGWPVAAAGVVRRRVGAPRRRDRQLKNKVDEVERPAGNGLRIDEVGDLVGAERDRHVGGDVCPVELAGVDADSRRDVHRDERDQGEAGQRGDRVGPEPGRPPMPTIASTSTSGPWSRRRGHGWTSRRGVQGGSRTRGRARRGAAPRPCPAGGEPGPGRAASPPLSPDRPAAARGGRHPPPSRSTIAAARPRPRAASGSVGQSGHRGGLAAARHRRCGRAASACPSPPARRRRRRSRRRGTARRGCRRPRAGRPRSDHATDLESRPTGLLGHDLRVVARHANRRAQRLGHRLLGREARGQRRSGRDASAS